MPTSIRILSSPDICQEYTDCCHELLVGFVRHFQSLYGVTNMTYNLHSLIHLSSQVTQFGCLENASAFPFENYLGTIKRMIRKPSFPLEQVIRRLYEEQSIIRSDEPKTKITLKREHFSGPIPEYLRFRPQFKEANLEMFTIRTSKPDNCVQLKSHKVVLVENVVKTGDDNASISIVYRKFQNHDSWFEYPMDSTHLSIYKLSNLRNHTEICSISEIDKKCILFPRKHCYISIPLLHAC